MESQNIKHWMKLNLLLDHGCNALRKLFKDAWKAQFIKEWEPSSSSVILDHKLLQNNHQYLHKTIEKGDVNSWDITTLRAILTAEDLLHIPRKNIGKIHLLADKRNYLAHHPTKMIPEEEFNNLWDKITNILIFFGESKEILKQLKKSSFEDNVGLSLTVDDTNEENIKEAGKLKKEGNDKFKVGQFSEAIEIYTKSLTLSGVPTTARAVIHANRCACYLQQYKGNEYDENHLLKAQQDAQRCIELQADWYRGYFRLGQVHWTMLEYEKAVQCLNDALKQDPKKLEITRALKSIFEQRRKNHMKITNTENKKTLGYDNQVTDLKEELKLMKQFVAETSSTNCSLLPAVADAELTIGICYTEGVGVTADVSVGINWLQRSSDHECTNAANLLGLLYEYGKMNGKPNREKAEYYYKLAASNWLNPSNNAMVNLALLYEQQGDFELAYEWCIQAKRTGSNHPLLQELSIWLRNKKEEFLSSDVVDWEKKNKKTIYGLTMGEREERYNREVETVLASLARNIPGCRLKVNPTPEGKAWTRFSPSCCLKGRETRERKHRLCLSMKQQSLTAMYRMLKVMTDNHSVYMKPSQKVVENFLMMAQKHYMAHHTSEIECWDISILRQLVKLKTPITENLRVIMASYLVDNFAPELASEFIDECIQHYPRNGYFYARRARMKSAKEEHLDAVQDSNYAIILNPSNAELFYERAYMMYMALNTSTIFSREQVLEAYDQFTSYDDKGQEKMAEAYNTISQLKLSVLREKMTRELKSLKREEWEKRIGEVRRFQELSISFDVNASVSSDHCSAAAKAAFEDVLLQVQNKYDNLMHKQEINHAKRGTLILQHRMYAKKQREGLKTIPKEALKIKNTIQSNAYQTEDFTLEGFHPITFQEMEPTSELITYRGRSLAATVIEEAAYWSGLPQALVLVIEDTNGHAESIVVEDYRSLCITSKGNFIISDLPDYPTGFLPGQKLIILNPRVRQPGIHKQCELDYPKGIIRDGFIPKMCSYCLKPNANFTCTKCKKAKYCDKKCQSLDWTKLKHSLICCADD